MADSTLGLLFEIGADPSKAITGVEGMRQQFDRALGEIEEKFLSTLTRTLGISKEFAIGMGVAGGAVAALGAGMFELASKAAEAGSQIFEAAEKSGLAAENLSGLRAISQVTGESFDTLTMALGRAGRNLAVALIEPSMVTSKVLIAAMGGAQQFAELGLKPMDERIQVVLQHIMAMNDVGERNAALNALLGRGWMQNFSTLQLLAEQGYGPAIEKARQFGMFYDENAARQAREFTHAWADVKAELDALSLVMGEKLLPVVLNTIKGWMTLSAVLQNIGPWRMATGAVREWAASLLEGAAGPLAAVLSSLHLIAPRLTQHAADALRAADYDKAWAKAMADTDAFLKQLTQSMEKSAGATLDLGDKEAKLAKGRDFEMTQLRLRREQYVAMSDVVKHFSDYTDLQAAKLLAALQKEQAAYKNFQAVMVGVYKAGEAASKHWAEQIAADFRMVMEARRLDQDESDRSARQKADNDRAEEKSKNDLVKATIAATGEAMLAEIAGLKAVALIKAVYETAESIAAFARLDFRAGAMHALAAAKYGFSAAQSSGFGGGSHSASAASGAASGGGTVSGPPALAPGAASAQQGSTVRVVIVSGDASGRKALADALNQHTRFEGGQLLASKTLA